MTKFLFNGEEFETREEAEEYIYDDYACEIFDDYIDDNNNVEIFGSNYKASRVLKECSPTTYRCYYSDFCDILFDEIEEIEEEEEEEEEEE